LVIFCGDRTFGTYHALICGNSALRIEKSKLLHYKASISWIKERVPCRVRKFNFLSATEWVVVAVKGKDDGTKVKPIAFNWLGQRNMKNFFVGPIAHAPERLYWHLVNGIVVPCSNPNKCPICAERGKDDRRNHPTQKPLHAWEWLYLRLTDPGMSVYDPYAGVGSSGVAAARFKLKWVGTDISQEFADAGNLWLSGMWKTAITSDMDILSQLSILD
jgi:DNA modification methylase